jgi:PTH1 family peptidyl-tRNA hydrolase
MDKGKLSGKKSQEPGTGVVLERILHHYERTGTMIKAAAFLGNMGREYGQTRHNAGWMVIDRLGEGLGLAWRDKFNGSYAVLPSKFLSCHVLKPDGYMNESGKSIAALLVFFKLAAGELLVVHDDLELGFGSIGYKAGGGSGGHNGLRSIASSIGSDVFHRLRIGIGRPNHPNVASYVLSKFTVDEQAVLPVVLDKAAAVLAGILKGETANPETVLKKVNLLD